MKPIITISAAMLLALSLAACDNDNQDNAPASNSDAMAETNTAGGSESTGATGENLGSDSQMQDGSLASGSMNDDSMGSESESDSMSDSDAMGQSDSSSSSDAMNQSGNQTSSDEDMPKAAVAVLTPTEGNEPRATIRFTPQDGGLAYTTEATGLNAGKHGYHIHVYGDCSAPDGKSAGTHFNLKGSSKNPPEDIDRITGNLGVLEAGEDGNAEGEGTLENASLTGAKSIIGRAIIIHQKGNDESKPPIGAAGPRQACGVIGIGESQS